MTDSIHITTIVVGSYAVNCYLVYSDEDKKGFLIDPGSDTKRIQAEIQKQGVHIECILNTHCHGDHIGSVASLCKNLNAKYGRSAEEDPLLKESFNINLLMLLEGEMPPKPDILLNHGETLEISPVLKVKVIETPGHTPGGVSLLLNDTHLFTGDSLFKGSVGRTDIPLADHETLIASLRKNILSLPDDIKVYPGHEGHSTIGEERRTNPFLQ